MAVKARAEVTLSSVTDVKAVYRYYLLQSSTLAKPAEPTQNPPGGSWDDTEPSYTSGSTNSLYVVDLTVFSDDTFQYSDVSLSSSYEAAKAAYNKAVAAQSTANSAQESIDSLQVGGRNLLRYTKEVTGHTTYVSGTSTNAYEIDSEGFCVTTIQATGAYNSLSFYLPDIPIEDLEGKQVVISMWVKSDGLATAPASYQLCAGVFASGNTRRRYKGFGNFNSTASNYNIQDYVDGEWVRLVCKVTLPLVSAMTVSSATEDYVKYGLQIYVNLSNTQYPLQIKKVKCEFGNTPTDWTPAPEDVESELAEVKETAENAKSIANGKNTVYYSTTQPTGSLKAGDIWFNTSDGGINFYNGSAWVTHQVGTVSIADGSVIADKIAVDTLAAICANLGDVTVGGVNGKNGSITFLDSAGKSLFSISTSLDGVQIRNFIFGMNQFGSADGRFVLDIGINEDKLIIYKTPWLNTDYWKSVFGNDGVYWEYYLDENSVKPSETLGIKKGYFYPDNGMGEYPAADLYLGYGHAYGADNTPLCYRLGDTISSYCIATGLLTSSQTALGFFLPTPPVCGGATPIMNSLTMILRHADGGYPYARSGSSGGTYTQLGSAQVSVWNNGKTVRTNEISDITCTRRVGGISVVVTFTYPLAKASGSTTAVTNNVPMAVACNYKITLSDDEMSM